ncbi:MAG: gamma-glutamyltransferase [Planctomycetaceae bacterium]|nr:gamma-glutamyltransferase [Planctomycetaceae bacterium]MCB9949811.1 gamma-glutamyltransferase [Planctomycetaceae bacterium]
MIARVAFLLGLSINACVVAGAPETFPHAAVVSQSEIASKVGADVLRDGGNAVDAAVATAFALAVTHPAAGNIGGGGFLVYRSGQGNVATYDFRERAPLAASETMWLDENGNYDSKRHHSSWLSVGVPGSVAGLHLAWSEQGQLPWRRLVEPAIQLAEEGFVVSPGLAESLKDSRSRFRISPAALSQFTNNGMPYEPGEVLIQRDLAATLRRIAEHGPAGFYEGKTAELLVAGMQSNGGILTHEDLRAYKAVRREPIRGTYRGYDIISMPPPSSGGITLVQMLNILEGFPIRETGAGSAATLHVMTESMRRAYLNRARYLGDSDFNPDIPVARLISKEVAKNLRNTIKLDAATPSVLEDIRLQHESNETTHLSVVDKDLNAVSLTTTLEYSYGSGIIAEGTGFLLNNEMGDFNPVPGKTTEQGLIGTSPNLTQPGKRMLSSMSPTIVARDGKLVLVTGSPGGRTIINTVLQTILNVVDHDMNAQDAVDFGRIHHQWMPDELRYEQFQFSPDTLEQLKLKGHRLKQTTYQGSAHIIKVNSEGQLEAGVDHRRPDAGAAGH